MSQSGHAGSLQKPRLGAGPTTRAGRLCVWLLLGAVIAIALNAAVVMPFTESRTGLDTFQQVFNAVVALSLLSSGLVGAWAVIRENERSWVVFLAIVLTLVVFAFELVEFING